MDDPVVFLKWLETLRDHGVVRLRCLPRRDGLLEEVATRIGPVRENNFGRHYVLAIKDNASSQACTCDTFLQRIDPLTRESPHGRQLIFARENTTSGGEGIFVDGYRLADDMRREDPDHFLSPSTSLHDSAVARQHEDRQGPAC